MKIATVLFTYNRSWHTEQVLSALKDNTVLPEKLYIFQDGLKQEEHKLEWEKTQKVIKEINWCDCEVIIADKNKGLACSIVEGVNYLFSLYDAVIVLEDDCVPHILFMDYMINALEHYAEMKKVYSIGAYAYPVEVEGNGTDVYAVRRATSWGWATWKDRWKAYKEDYRILGRIKKDKNLNEQFNIWGRDLENYLLGNVYGYCDSWATFWALNIIENEGYCISPYKSLIKNIGFDGSGVHCGTSTNTAEMLEEINEKRFVFDDKLKISARTEINYANYWGGCSKNERNECYYNILLKWMQLHMQRMTLASYFEKKHYTHVCIWGKGKLCDLLLNEIESVTNIGAIIESKPSTNIYKGIPVVSPKEISNETQLIIVIPEYDIKKIDKYLKFNQYYGDVIGLSEIFEAI